MKQFRSLQKELQLNNFFVQKQSKLTLIESLAYSLGYSQEDFLLFIKLTVYFNARCCDNKRAQRTNPFPVLPLYLSQKYPLNSLSLKQFLLHPQYLCFSDDLIEISCIACRLNVITFSLDSEGYLHQTGFAVKNPFLQLLLVKVSTTKYCLVKKIQKMNEEHYYIKNILLEEIIQAVCGKESQNTNQIILKNHLENNQIDLVMQKNIGDIISSINIQNRLNQVIDQSNQITNQCLLLTNNQRYKGSLTFFDQNANYGFILVDKTHIELFVHYDDLLRAGFSKQRLIEMKNNFDIQFQFTFYQDEWKQIVCKKAVDLKLIKKQSHL